MSAPIKVSAPPGIIYDEEEQVCRLADPELAFESPAEPEPLDRSRFSMSGFYHQAFGPSSRPALTPARSLFSHSPLTLSGWTAFGSVAGCGPDSPDAPSPGDPIDRVEALGGEIILNPAPILGNIDGVGLASAASNRSVVAWSAFDGTDPANSGTFAFLRAGESGGSSFTVSDEVSSRHLSTSAVTLSDGNSLVVFTRATGPDSPSSIVAQRVSSSGAPVGGEIEIFPPEIRDELPSAQVVATATDFVAVYRNGAGNLEARLFSNSGSPSGAAVNLGSAPAQYSLAASGSGNRWGLAEISPPGGIHIRTFDGSSERADQDLSTPAFPSDPDISLAMQPDGGMMVAWNAQDGGDHRIDGAILDASAEVLDGPFVMRRSGLVNTLALAADHRGNYFFAWEEGGSINARIYNGTEENFTPADFSSISTGNENTNILLSVSPEGILSMVYDKSAMSAGEVSHDITRRDYRIVYE